MEQTPAVGRLALVPGAASAAKSTIRGTPARVGTIPEAPERRVQPAGDPDDRTLVAAPGRPQHLGLLLVSAPDPGVVGSYFPLDAPELVIGRMGEAQICVNDPGVSRSHLKIFRGPSGEVIAQDLGSTNGTWVNGIGIRSAALAAGDRLQVGTSTEFLFGLRREGALSEIRLRQAISTAGAGTWEWLLARGELRIHGGLARAVGYEADTTDPHAGDSWARVHPEDRQALRDHLEAALREGGRFEHEVRLVRPNGGITWVALNGEQFRDQDNRPVRLAGALLDITNRRRAEGELRRQSLLFDSLADAVVVVGADGSILDWSASAQRLLGWSKAEALGRRPGPLLLPAEAGRLDATLVECACGGGRRSEEFTFWGKSGAEVPVEMVAVPLANQEEELVACVAVFRDLGERRRLQARLQLAERLASIGTLAAGVAHEINNPLAFLVSNLEYLDRQVAAAKSGLGAAHPEMMAALADSRKGASRIAGIVHDLQAFNRKEQPGTPAAVDPNAVLEFALRMADNTIRHRGRVVKELDPVPQVAGGEARLSQVFLNLLVNAAHAIEPGRTGGAIRVATRFDPAARRVVIEIADNGVGIAPEVLPRIFEPFFTTKPVGAGTGLGLFVCQGIVTELGGEITVASEVGKGTTFRVLLPAVGSVPLVEQPLPRVLAVDDEPLIAVALQRCFAGRYEIVAVADPREALERVQSGERFLFALVDLQMPKMSGREFLARLREAAPELARRSAVCTGVALDEAGASFTDEERPLLLSKPIDLERLAQLIDAASEAEQRSSGRASPPVVLTSRRRKY